MKRLVPLVLTAAAALGTGCGPTCDSGTTLVSWSGFDGPGGAVNQRCEVAGVASVDLWLDNQFVGNWPCIDYGAAIPGVPTGGNILDVEGIAQDGTTILYRDELNYGQTGCDSMAVQAFPGAGTVDLQYAFQSGGACTSGTSYMWFTIFDDIANAVDPSSVDANDTPRAFPCGPNDPIVTLPNGQYDLASMAEMTETSPNVFQQTANGCGLPITFPVTTGNQTVITPSLADTGAACL